MIPPFWMCGSLTALRASLRVLLAAHLIATTFTVIEIEQP